MRTIILGIDGGGTKTVCLAADDTGATLGRGLGGPANYLSEGVERVRQSLRCAIRDSLHEAGADCGDVAVLAAGLAGASRERDRQVICGILHEVVPDAQLRIEPDAVIALLGATGGEPGLIVISGTGSMALGMDRRERRTRTGGWGFILGDEGSGYDIARRGLIACLRAYDGRGPDTLIRPKVIAALSLESTEDLIPFLYSNPSSPGRIAALYPLVLEAADEGDPVAESIIGLAADALVEMAVTTAAKLDFARDQLLMTTAGGVFKGRSVRERFEAVLSERCPQAKLLEAKDPPEVGAVMMARRVLARAPLFTPEP